MRQARGSANSLLHLKTVLHSAGLQVRWLDNLLPGLVKILLEHVGSCIVILLVFRCNVTHHNKECHAPVLSTTCGMRFQFELSLYLHVDRLLTVNTSRTAGNCRLMHGMHASVQCTNSRSFSAMHSQQELGVTIASSHMQAGLPYLHVGSHT